jgi:hypothetical protein
MDPKRLCGEQIMGNGFQKGARMSEIAKREYGIKYDGESLSIYLGKPFRTVYWAWPKFQCMKRAQNTGIWYSAAKGNINLNTGLVGFFVIAEMFLEPVQNGAEPLKGMRPVAILPRKSGKYYEWDSEDSRPFSDWYRENKERITSLCGAFIEEIPASIRDQARQFRHGIFGSQWFLLKHSHMYAPFFDLMCSNPALAFVFAHRRLLGIKAPRLGKKDTEMLLAGKQRKIAAYLGLDDSNAIVSILKKIPPSACSRIRLEGFLESLSRKELHKTLLHLETITEPVILLYGRLKSDAPESFIPSKGFVEDVAAHFPPQDSVYSVERELWINYSQPISRVFHYFENEKLDFQSLHELHHKYQKAIEIMNREQLPGRERKYPRPPVPGSDVIVPIASRRELFEEGLDQKNCAFRYDADIIAGRQYFYRILAPERATLSLRKVRIGPRRPEWRIDEIKLKANNSPNPQSIQAVKEWFETATAKS